MSNRLMLLAAVASLALAACDHKSAAPATTDTAAITQAIKAHETQWMADYNARDPDKLVGHFADEAASATPGTALATTREARHAGYVAFVADPTLKVDFASDKVDVAASGDLAYSRGHYTVTTTDPATKAPKVEEGSYLTVWKKQADGDWKAVEDFSLPGPAPATGAAG